MHWSDRLATKTCHFQGAFGGLPIPLPLYHTPYTNTATSYARSTGTQPGTASSGQLEITERICRVVPAYAMVCRLPASFFSISLSISLSTRSGISRLTPTLYPRVCWISCLSPPPSSTRFFLLLLSLLPFNRPLGMGPGTHCLVRHPPLASWRSSQCVSLIPPPLVRTSLYYPNGFLLPENHTTPRLTPPKRHR